MNQRSTFNKDADTASKGYAQRGLLSSNVRLDYKSSSAGAFSGKLKAELQIPLSWGIFIIMYEDSLPYLLVDFFSIFPKPDTHQDLDLTDSKLIL